MFMRRAGFFFLCCFAFSCAVFPAPIDEQIRAWTEARSIAEKKSLLMPAEGPYVDPDTGQVYFNKKPISISAQFSQMDLKVHPYGRFLTVKARSPSASKCVLFYEGRRSWEQLYQPIAAAAREQQVNETFTVETPWYAHDSKGSYFLGRNRTGPRPNMPYIILEFFPLEGESAYSTLKVFDDPRYCSTRTAVYFCGTAIPGADPDTFSVPPLPEAFQPQRKNEWNLCMEDFEQVDYSSRITRDHNRIFFNYQTLDVKPADDFMVLGSSVFRNGGRIWTANGRKTGTDRGPAPVAAAETQSFVVLDANYARDKDHVFLLQNDETSVLEADPGSFQALCNGYSKDANQVLMRGTVVVPGQSESFRILERGYAVDSGSVYFEGYKIPNAEPASFRVISLLPDTRERLKDWYRIDPDGLSFGYDSRRVFFGREIAFEGVPQSFDLESYIARMVSKQKADAKWVDFLHDLGIVQY
jgi:hypothetical protein